MNWIQKLNLLFVIVLSFLFSPLFLIAIFTQWHVQCHKSCKSYRLVLLLGKLMLLMEQRTDYSWFIMYCTSSVCTLIAWNCACFLDNNTTRSLQLLLSVDYATSAALKLSVKCSLHGQCGLKSRQSDIKWKESQFWQYFLRMLLGGLRGRNPRWGYVYWLSKTFNCSTVCLYTYYNWIDLDWS